MSTTCAAGCQGRVALARSWRPMPGRAGSLVPGRPMVGRLVRLYAGLVLFGLSVALMVAARLGLDPWDVFHQGLSRRTGLPLGWVVNGVAALVLLLWIPLRQRPGAGTVSNVIVVGLVIN